MNRLMMNADERLRTLLHGEPSRLLLLLLDAAVALCFAALMMTRTFGQLAGAGLAARLVTVGMLCLPLLVMLRFAARCEGSLLAHALLGGVMAAAMLARVSFLDRVSSDYELYLSGWMDQFAAGSFSDAMRGNVGDYNVLYQYMLFAITRLPVPRLYAVKALSFAGDAFLAGAAAKLAGKDGKWNGAALCAVLLLPTCVINGGMFAQCDSLYAACALWGLALALGGKPMRSAACFALSLAFKLQAVFLLPVVAVLWCARKLRLSDALVFVGTLILTALPALLFGKGLAQLLSIYMGQAGQYTALTYNAPTLFGLMNTNGIDPYAYGNFGMALALGAAFALTALSMARAEDMDGGDFVHLALSLVLVIVFLLPRMHERYFFMADVLAVALACRDRRFVLPAALIQAASLSGYWDLGISLQTASAMMLLAAALTLARGNGACAKKASCV